MWSGCRNDRVKGFKAQADPLWCKLVTFTWHGPGLGRRKLWQLVDKLQCDNGVMLGTHVEDERWDDRTCVSILECQRSVFHLPHLDIVGNDV